jgi:hypothetical protein
MSQRHTTKGSSPRSSHQGGPAVWLELSLRSEVSAISPFVDTLMRLTKKFRWVAEDEEDIEVALYEVLANAVIQAIMRTLRSKYVLAVAVGLTRSPSSSGTKDKDLTSARFQTLLLRKISAPVMAVESI